MTPKQVKKLLARKKGILLDISLGGETQPRSVHMSPMGDLKYDPTWRALGPHFHQKFPLPDSCVHTAVVTHVLEYLAPQQFFTWWDELHRVMQPSGIVYVSGPYGGDESCGWISDPQHVTRVIEQSFAWLDPRTPFYEVHDNLGRPRPKPWHPLTLSRVPGAHGTLSYNVTLQKPKQEALRKKEKKR
jgi:hypothetical protein